MTPENKYRRENRKYSVVEYNPAWPEKFNEIKLFLESVFKEKLEKIEHFGSTAIPGMKAKPVVDVLLVVKKMENFTEERDEMISAGWKFDANYDEPGGLGFYKTNEDGSKSEKVLIFETNSRKEKKVLVMRDYFRAFPEKSKEYSQLKEKNYLLHQNDYPAYQEAKSTFLKQIEKEAFEWDSSKN